MIPKIVKCLHLVDYYSIFQTKINLKKIVKYVALSTLSMYYTWKNKSYKNKKFKTSSPTWNEKFEFPDGSYFVTDIQNWFEYVIIKTEKLTNNPQIRKK